MTTRHAGPETAHIQQAGEGFRIHWHMQPPERAADGQTPSGVDSARDGDTGPAETPRADYDKKGPSIPCFYALLIAVGTGVALAAIVLITLLAAMGWIG